MKTGHIARPVPGEHLVALYPGDAEGASVVWSRRLRMFTGRTLTAPALKSEQDGRAGRFALAGRRVSRGLVHGLEVGLERSVESETIGEGMTADVVRHYVHIAPGMGLAVSGEDVTVPVARRVNLAHVDVDAPAALTFTGDPVEAPPVASGAGGPGRARHLWGSLGSLLQAGAALPRVGVLVLQPVIHESLGDLDLGDECGPGSGDPCELDPEAYAFENWQLIDGCRLVLYAWPVDVLPLPPEDERWRNRLAYTVFEAERTWGRSAPLPWEGVGVPLALLGFEEASPAPPRDPLWDRGEMSWAPSFIDQHSVARLGGRPRGRARPSGAEVNPYLWQARFRQFSEQMADPDVASLPVAERARLLRFLPPVGILPPDAVDARAGTTDFFPATYGLEASPVPTEQLDLVLHESAGLTPFDLFAPDEVRVYVPVPQIWYEPDLLRVEEVSPEFGEAIQEYALRRGRWLSRRGDVRSKASALTRAVTGEALVFPDPDPEALEADEALAEPIDPADPQLSDPEKEFGTSESDDGPVVDEIARLRSDLLNNTPVRHRTRLFFPGSAPSTAALPTTLRSRFSVDATAQTIEIKGRLSVAERDQLIALDGASEWRDAVTGLHQRSLQDELTKLDELGLKAFIELLEAKIATANDKVDLGFARVQTDIYRIRQYVLGTDAASRLATSPALAQIAKGESARATEQSLSSLLSRVGISSAVPGKGDGGASAPIPASSTGGAAAPAPAPAPTVVARASHTLTRALPMTGVVRAVGPVSGAAPSGAEVRGGSAAALGGFSLTTAETLRLATMPGVLGAGAAPSVDDVTEQQPIVGKAANFRTVSVAERLQAPAAVESKSFTVASKFTVLKDIAGLDLNIDDLEVPGFYSYAPGATSPELDDVPDPRSPDKTIQVPRERSFNLGRLRSSTLLNEVLFDRHDLDPADGDEASFFGGGIRALDHSIAALRLVEGRIQAYRRAIKRCEAALETIESHLSDARSRLAVIDDEVAEARYDVSVARALLAEEQQRIGAINAQRDRIIADHVEFLVFQRPRLSDIVRDLPARALRSGLVPAPVPACLSHNPVVPEDLRELLEMVRESPVRWFPRLQGLLDRLDRKDALLRTLTAGRLRALNTGASPRKTRSTSSDGSRFGLAVTGLLAARGRSLTQAREATARLDLTALSRVSWTGVRAKAVEVTSLADLIEAGHGQASVARAATEALHQMTTVAGCLYEGFGGVLPALRLGWAERLSQFDASVSLRNLATLPRWGDVDPEARRTLQALVDWLFAQVDVRLPDAVATVNDIVRLALLLASHAPVNRILAGHVPAETTVQPKGRVELKVDLSRVRIGMHVQLFTGASVVASAVVEDLSGEMAAARVLSTSAPSVQLAAGTRAQFVDAERAAGVLTSHVGTPAFGGLGLL